MSVLFKTHLTKKHSYSQRVCSSGLIRKVFKHCRPDAPRPRQGQRGPRGGRFTSLTSCKMERREAEDSYWQQPVSQACLRRDLWTDRGLETVFVPVSPSTVSCLQAHTEKQICLRCPPHMCLAKHDTSDSSGQSWGRDRYFQIKQTSVSVTSE